MPKKFNRNEINFTSGTYGTENVDNNNIQYKVNGNTIKGKYNGSLKPNEGITIKLNLDHNYFDFYTVKDYSLPVAIVPGILGLLLLFKYIKKGRDKIVPIPSFKPPKDLNSAEIGYIINGKINNKDMASLIIEWATKGYLTIHNKGKKSFELEKIKDADNQLKDYERTLFKKIFYKDRVTLEELKKKSIGNDFNNASIQLQLSNGFNTKDNKVFLRISRKLRFLAFILSFVSITAVSFIYNYQEYLVPSYALFAAVSTAIFTAITFIPWIKLSKYHYKMKRLSKLFFYMIAGFLSSSALLIFITYSRVNYITNTILLFITVVCIVIFLSPTKRSKEGKAWLEEILGFQEFIKTERKEQLKMLAHDNPAYFYDVLPYAYALGISKVWAKKFESLTIPEPTWYYGRNYNRFSTMNWYRSFNQSMHSLKSTSNSVAASNNSGSGSFGGGGSSGGGFGGGSRGSW